VRRRFVLLGMLGIVGLFGMVSGGSAAALVSSSAALYSNFGASVVSSTSDAGAVGTRRFILENADDFKGGDLKGVAIDASGKVHAGLNLGAQPVTEVATIWSALPTKDGLLLGTGNDGKLLSFKDGKVTA